MNQNLAAATGNLLEVLQSKKPLVHHLTNYAIMDSISKLDSKIIAKMAKVNG
jgi:hydroxyethylthiazole kinase-like sugar kinase family protein